MPDFLFCNAELFKKRKKKKKRKEEHKTLPGCLKYAKIAKLGKEREGGRKKKKVVLQNSRRFPVWCSSVANDATDVQLESDRCFFFHLRYPRERRRASVRQLTESLHPNEDQLPVCKHSPCSRTNSADRWTASSCVSARTIFLFTEKASPSSSVFCVKSFRQ